MKQIFLLLLSIVILSCGSDDTGASSEVDLTNVEAIKSALKDKRTEASKLKLEIDDLVKQLAKVDPTSIKEKPQVEVKPIAPATFESFSTFQANVVADETATATSQTGGIITSLNVEEGDYVKKGQLIATVNMETMEKQRVELETTLSLATTVFERQQRLWKQNIGSELQYLEAKNNKERLEKSLQTMGSQINLKNVYSPINGVVDMIMLKQGELSSPGIPIVKIMNTGKLKIAADLPDSYLSSIKRGQTVEVYFPALDLNTSKTITELGRQIDPTNRTFLVGMNTGSMGGKIKPNLLAEVKVKDQVLEDVIMVPVNIVQQEVNGDNYVYVVENGVAKKKLIITGISNDEFIVIEDGLQANDQIIVKGANGLSNGDMVNASVAQLETEG